MGAMCEGWGEKLPGKYGYSGVGAVVGATYPAQLEELRAAMPHTFFLVPGYGAQAALPTTWPPALTRTAWAPSSTPPGALCAPGRRRASTARTTPPPPAGKPSACGMKSWPHRPDCPALREERDHEIRFQACKLLSARQLTGDVFDFVLEAPALAAMAQPGQFAQIRVPGHTLRRPISICGIDKAAGTLRFVFQIRGEGTAELAQFQPGSTIEILAPLGNGFPVDKSKRTLLVGGGIGVPPLLGVAAQLGEKAIAVLGFPQ